MKTTSSPLGTERLEKFFRPLAALCTIIGATVLLLVLGNLALGVWQESRDYLQREQAGASRIPGLSYFPEGYFSETGAGDQMELKPYYLWKSRPHAGKAITVDAEGNRRTVKSPRPGARKVFLFGGSAMWGVGAPDDQTIASHLQRLLGDGYDIYNFGELGFVSSQELNLLLEQLTKGNIPDTVVFYDGVNDVIAGAYSPARPREPLYSQEDFAELYRAEREQGILHGFRSWLSALESAPRAEPLFRKPTGFRLSSLFANRFLQLAGNGQAWSEKVIPLARENSAKTVLAYEHLIRQVNGIASAYGFKARFFLQPTLLTQSKRSLSPWEKRVSDQLAASQKAIFPAFQEAYPLARARLSRFRNFTDLSSAFDEEAGLVFFDFCHVGGEANAALAAKIRDSILKPAR